MSLVRETLLSFTFSAKIINYFKKTFNAHHDILKMYIVLENCSRDENFAGRNPIERKMIKIE